MVTDENDDEEVENQNEEGSSNEVEQQEDERSTCVKGKDYP